ncbi:transposase, partial [Coprobacillus sp. AF13-4LB]
PIKYKSNNNVTYSCKYHVVFCPICGRIQHAKDRNYICRCGYHTHRDLLGAINICNSTEYIGNRYTA